MAAVYTRDQAEYAVAKSAQPVPARWAAPALLGFGAITLLCTLLPLVLPRRPQRTQRIISPWWPLRSLCLCGCLYGKRYERWRLWTACVSLFFVPQFIVGASNLLGLHVEGLEAQALADTTGCSRTVTYQYDDNGNLHGRTVAVGTQVTERNLYVFNSEDRLVVFDPQFDPNAPAGQYSAGATYYAYDQDGVRTSKTTGGVTTYYVVDKNRDLPQVLEEREQQGETVTLKVRYLYGHDLLAQVRTVDGNQEYSYYHYDGQLSTRQLTDDAAAPGDVAVRNNYTYDAFGADLTHAGLPGSSPGAPENLYRYTGEQHDPATGFYYLRARYYAPETGRFASRDRYSGDPQAPTTLHKYLYCGADPVNGVDPSGLFVGVQTLTTVQVIALVSVMVIYVAVLAWLAYCAVATIKAAAAVRAVAQNLRARVDVAPPPPKPDGPMVFVHGTTTTAWHGSTIRHDAGRADTDFGQGFYAFNCLDPHGYETAVRRARDQVRMQGGTPIVIVATMRRSDFAKLRCADFRAPPWSAQYDDVVNQCRSGRDILAAEGTDVAVGPVARIAGGRWVPNPAYPDQYAFKTARSVSFFGLPITVVQVGE